jgi:hypothetical protein
MLTDTRARIRWYRWRANPLNWIDLFSGLTEPPKPAPIIRGRPARRLERPRAR